MSPKTNCAINGDWKPESHLPKKLYVHRPSQSTSYYGVVFEADTISPQLTVVLSTRRNICTKLWPKSAPVHHVLLHREQECRQQRDVRRLAKYAFHSRTPEPDLTTQTDKFLPPFQSAATTHSPPQTSSNTKSRKRQRPKPPSSRPATPPPRSSKTPTPRTVSSSSSAPAPSTTRPRRSTTAAGSATSKKDTGTTSS